MSGSRKVTEREGAERLGDEDVGDLAELGEVVAQVLLGDVVRAAADEHLAGYLVLLSLLPGRRRQSGAGWTGPDDRHDTGLTSPCGLPACLRNRVDYDRHIRWKPEIAV